MSAYTVTSRSFVVSGLNVKIYCHPSQSVCEAFAPLPPVSVLFFLHGRGSSLTVVEPIIEKVVMMAHSDDKKRDLYVVGLVSVVPLLAKLSSPMGTQTTRKFHVIYMLSGPQRLILDCRLDMYGIQLGTQRDLSHLIDFLPSHLFPHGERTIEQWGVAGISLGGHTAWLALAHEPRITFGIVILGCADYLALMSRRAAESEFELTPPTLPILPPSLVSLVRHVDPIYTPYTVNDSRNPFLGKKILVLRGAMDRIVPWSASARFVHGLEVGERGLKTVMAQEGVGHECTVEMTKWMAEFLRYECLSSKIAAMAKL
ncbi:hypothetical protein PLEOSDRAFT_1102666 [Pleurotus ostreatus PC15]|uniref:Peptidase S9 prolyl oligopeptidase catalytic domain-containing protein n=1 Tax=Pleurotus ostreatus (strain PC15) TaxID=1137138 RepID=A0A067NYC6_PLEO1|nr:hypothetical protein PLEOSDRAFT_1102666 [Pleurotus ostreatus PC15]